MTLVVAGSRVYSLERHLVRRRSACRFGWRVGGGRGQRRRYSVVIQREGEASGAYMRNYCLRLMLTQFRLLLDVRTELIKECSGSGLLHTRQSALGGTNNVVNMARPATALIKSRTGLMLELESEGLDEAR
jgi:hypothetical protein